MPFKPGQSGNLKGRPKAPRYTTLEKRALIENIVESILKDEKSIDELLNLKDPAKKWDIVAKLLPYYVPRLETEAPGAETPVSTLDTFKERLKEKVA